MQPTEIFKFVHPINLLHDYESCGVGVFVNHYFITAGHIAAQGDFKVKHNGKEYLFRKEDAILLDSTATIGKQINVHNVDLAIFPSTIESPIQLAIKPITAGEVFQCYTYFHGSIPATGTSVFYGPNDVQMPKVSQVNEIELYDNFVEGTTEILMGTGNSGSPLLRGNELVGVLSGNQDSNPFRILYCMPKL